MAATGNSAACDTPSSTRVNHSVVTAGPAASGIRPVASDATLQPSKASISAARAPKRSPNMPAGTWKTV